MLKNHRKTMRLAFRALDLFIIHASFFIAYVFRFGTDDLFFFKLPLQYIVFFSMYTGAWVYFAHRYHLYVSKRLIGFRSEAMDVLQTTLLSLVFALLPAFFLRESPLSREFLLYLWPIQAGILVFFRFIGRFSLRYIRVLGFNYRQFLIVGQNARSSYIARKIEENAKLGVRILGFIDVPNSDNGHYRAYPFNNLGNLDDLEMVLRKNVVDEVLVTLPVKTHYGEVEEIIRVCEEVGIDVKVSIDAFGKRFARAAVLPNEIIPVIDLSTSPKIGLKFIFKRIFDFSVSLVALLLLSPLLVFVAILVKLTSEGPIFFKQERVGYNGRLFTLLKFRTMVANAEALKEGLMAQNEMDGPVFKIKNDPRITRLGQFLRKTSIDELPQLLNVLLGDMSLVGPRPPVLKEVDQYKLMNRRRLSIKPGITCIWQVSGRNNIPFDRWMELDQEYINHWSLWLDLKILIKTIPALLKGS